MFLCINQMCKQQPPLPVASQQKKKHKHMVNMKKHFGDFFSSRKRDPAWLSLLDTRSLG